MSNPKAEIKKKVKKHIPKDWLCELRIMYRLGMEAFHDIRRTGLGNIVIITTLVAILTIFGSFFRTALSMASFANELGSILEISVYLKNDTDTNAVKQTIKDYEYVETVTVIPKAKSWADLRRELELPDMTNPLPDTLHVKVDKMEHLEGVFAKIKQLPAVEDMSYAQDVAKKIDAMNQIVNTITVLVLIIMCILTITIINNTIQLVIQSRKEEIEIMRLMGVSNWYIRLPLILQGAFYGFSGALLALIPLELVESGLEHMHKFFMVPVPMYTQQIVVFTMFLIGILFGATGSFLCIKKHLQV
jgi:cell division transport system permease protein